MSLPAIIVKTIINQKQRQQQTFLTNKGATIEHQIHFNDGQHSDLHLISY